MFQSKTTLAIPAFLCARDRDVGSINTGSRLAKSKWESSITKGSIGVSSIAIGSTIEEGRVSLGLPLLLASTGDRDVKSIDTGSRLAKDIRVDSIGVGTIEGREGSSIEKSRVSLGLSLANKVDSTSTRHRHISGIHTGSTLESSNSIGVASITSIGIGGSIQESWVSLSHGSSNKGGNSNKELHDDDAALISWIQLILIQPSGHLLYQLSAAYPH